ncbi:protein of unknown function [Maridesulfovibrio ferrireducens]|uniref:DUF4345 domain-containing protein n=1 Tax=Maridesulfovibrio ferrireducens TaxID=246191 RepID=A0A1G9JIX2_9BACT|nr:DUF4345 domain-containing protein [Maridesulfovibrio ferrireducens]SDL37547.1 protein of unknown function [Maridesulfovibrio ferrireducens]
MILKKGVLVFSFVTITTIALLYGVSPQWFFSTFLVDSQIPNIDQSHILRAVMMLYIALGLFWLYCAFSSKFRDAGIIVLALFCGGLVAGRILSVIIDGLPSPILIVYILIEFSMVPVCIWLLKREKAESID